MKAVDQSVIDRVERNEMVRALHLHERKAAEIRGTLGLLTREKYENVEPSSPAVDRVTRMRTDQIDRLYESGKINIDERAAAQKFRTIWEAMGRGLFPGASGGGPVGTKSKGTFRHPLERMTDREFFIWHREYTPWANGPAAKTAIHHSQTGIKISYARVCYTVIVDNIGPSQLEKVWPVPRGHGAVAALFKAALSKWKHIEYETNQDLEVIRQQLLDAARARIDEVKPWRHRAS